jgi:Ulp1 family protease
MTEKSAQLCNPAPWGESANTQLHSNQILRFLGDEHLNKWGLPDATIWRPVLQDPQLRGQPNGCDCGIFVSSFVCFSVLNHPFHGSSGADPHLFADDLRFRFARSIMTKTIHF